MNLPLPDSPRALRGATWADLEPRYKSLADDPLSAASVRDWLTAWSTLDETVDEAYTLAMIAYTGNTADAEAEKIYLRWASEISPKLHEVRVALGRRLLPFANELPELALLIREIETDVRIFRAANLPRMAELEEMEAAYDKLTGGLTADWDGVVKTIPELNPFLLDRDRAVRERAYRKVSNAYLEHRGEMADLFSRMVSVRHALAREAGFDTYRDYVFAAKYRFDYTPADCTRFHSAVEAGVVPVLSRLRAARRETLGVDTLRPWDLQVHPDRASRLVPFKTADELIAGSERIFTAVDPELGKHFGTMAQQSLLDLESRLGKAPGGYCATLPRQGSPFIFMNAVGVHDDVNTLLHEAGHAFHVFLARAIRYYWRRPTGHEAAELASMSMELLAAKHLAAPTGFYDARSAADAQIEHLEDVLAGLPHIACVDAFQHWLYTDGLNASADERDAHWLTVRARFEPDVDHSGLERERVGRWYRQSHIFTAPFYYIEYGLAQIGALQVWAASLDDPRGALERYKAALSLGGTRTLPEIYAAAGASLVFDTATMERLALAVERRIAELREQAAS